MQTDANTQQESDAVSGIYRDTVAADAVCVCSLGEARGWPQNTKCRGTVADVAGFTKETAYWLKSWWLNNISAADAGLSLSLYVLHSHNHTLTHTPLTCTCCCYDQIKGTQDKDFSCSFSDSLSVCPDENLSRV